MFIQRLHEGVSVEIQGSPEKVLMVQLSRKATEAATLHPAPQVLRDPTEIICFKQRTPLPAPPPNACLSEA